MDGSISGTSGVTVNSGGMLSGIGTIDPPAVTINDGATLAPGNAANPFGALTITGTLLFNGEASTRSTSRREPAIIPRLWW